MKILFFLLIISNLAYSQIDTTNWYPLDIGNKWQFSYGIEEVFYYSKEVIGDTLMPNGKTYAIVRDGSNTRYERNHNNQFVYSYNRSDSSEYLLYDFISKDGTIWNVPWQNLCWGIQLTENDYNYYLGKNTRHKVFDWAIIDSSNNNIDTVWSAFIDVWSTRVTQGIGVSTDMNGAIINGDTIGVLTSVTKSPEMLNDYYLSQNYPNPFNPSTAISYSIPQSGFVQLKVYDLLGREVADLVGEEQTIGNYKIEFNANTLSSGIYFYKIVSGNYSNIKKMVLLR